MPICKILIGCPASGKSTYTKKHEKNYYIASSDKIMERFADDNGTTYNEVFFDMVKICSKIFYDNINRAIENGYDIIIDRTNMTMAARKKIISMFPPEYDIEAVVFDTPLEVILERNSKRPKGRMISENVVLNIFEKYEEPELEEGFSSIDFNVDYVDSI